MMTLGFHLCPHWVLEVEQVHAGIALTQGHICSTIWEWAQEGLRGTCYQPPEPQPSTECGHGFHFSSPGKKGSGGAFLRSAWEEHGTQSWRVADKDPVSLGQLCVSVQAGMTSGAVPGSIRRLYFITETNGECRPRLSLGLGHCVRKGCV